MGNSEGENKKVAFHTLGCKLNFSETSTISRNFKEKGFDVVEYNSAADIYVINTCSVTEHADKKCRQSIKKVQNINPNAFIAVVGCYAQLKPEEIAKNLGVDLVLGSRYIPGGGIKGVDPDAGKNSLFTIWNNLRISEQLIRSLF